MSMRAPLGSRDNEKNPTIPQVEQLGYAFLAPSALTVLISAIEMGIIIMCFARFLTRSEKERRAIKALVYFVSCVAVCVSSILSVMFPHSLGTFFFSFSLPLLLPMNCQIGFKRQ